MIRRYSYAINMKPFEIMFLISLLFYIAFYFNSTVIITIKLAIVAIISYLITSSLILHIKYFTRVVRSRINTVFDYRFPSFHTGITANLITVYDYFAYYYTNELFFSIMLLITVFILIITGYARYYSNHHTLYEIIAGLLIGIFTGVVTCMIKIF